jgi:hypothetical protein
MQMLPKENAEVSYLVNSSDESEEDDKIEAGSVEAEK